MVIEGQLLNMPLRQLSITTTSKKREHGKLRKDVKVRDINKTTTKPIILLVINPRCM